MPQKRKERGDALSMRLRLLKIHNIASIGDAEIDFVSGPLSACEVFLISGKTGSGKSTILDAICLALYDNTPRLSGTRMEGSMRDEGARRAKSGDNMVRIDSPAQLLSRGVGEGHVVLEFTGNNNKAYKAEWSVARANNNPARSLKKPVWQLTCLDTGLLLTKKTEIKAEIAVAVGLDFSQFCRTTMLAQGEFSRFLNSKDDEKSEILEKITGVDIYTRVGRKTYEICSLKEKAYRDAKREADCVHLLTTEELDSLRSELSAVSRLLAETGRLKASADAKIAWLLEEKRLIGLRGEADAAYMAAKNVYDSEETSELARLSAEWGASSEARGMYARLQEVRMLREELEKEKLALTDRFVGFVGGLRFVGDEMAKAAETKEEHRIWLDSEAAFEGVYKDCALVCNLVEMSVSVGRHLEREEKRLDKIKATLENGFSKKAAMSERELVECNKAIADIDGAIAKKEKALDALGLPSMRNRKESLLSEISALGIAVERVLALAAVRERKRAMLEDMARKKERMTICAGELTRLEKAFAVARAEYDASSKVLALQRLSTDKWAKAVRSQLRPGDDCPVCGRKIEEHLASDAEFESVFAESDRFCALKKTEAERLQKECSELAAEIKAFGKSVDSTERQLAEDRSEEEMRQAASDACGKCGIVLNDDVDEEMLKNRKDVVVSLLDALAKEISKAEDVEASLKEDMRRRSEIERHRERVSESIRSLKDEETRLNRELDLCLHTITLKEREKGKAIEALRGLLGGCVWDVDWIEHPEDFSARLRKRVLAYEERKSRMAECENLLAELSSAKEAALSVFHALEPVASVFLVKEPDIDSVIGKKVADLSSFGASLQADVKSLLDRIGSIDAQEKEYMASLDEYYSSDGALSPERLREMSGMTDAYVSSVNARLAEIRENLSLRRGISEAVTCQMNEHIENRPEMAEGDTMESLSGQSEDLQRKLVSLGERKGAVEMKLRLDSGNRSVLGDMLARVAVLKEESDRWNSLNVLLGSSDGKKFRKIAQSYVLSCLVNSANGYMRTLSDRYTLVSVPGTFVISVEDAYQGYARRPASTISGGESFLVSLSLALALSDIGSGLTVDTLFIDEGFGTLSGEHLQRAIDTLRTLHAKSGRRVGIISHVEELKERIPVQVLVEQESGSAYSSIRFNI